MIGSQSDPQPEVSKGEVHPQYTPPLQRSDRVHHASLRFDDNMINIIQDDDPLIYSKAVMSRDSDRWLKAMKSEMDPMYINQVRILVDAPKGVISIGCKWILKKKIGVDG